MKNPSPKFRSPFLRTIELTGKIKKPHFPFNIPLFSKNLKIELTTPLTCFVGENGTGKSTLLEAIAHNCGFNTESGGRNHFYGEGTGVSELQKALRVSWHPRVASGFFLRAESFFNYASYIDELAEVDPTIHQYYGGKSLHHQSHGESFLSLFQNRLRKGIYLLDEPEAALSPQRQLTLLRIIHDAVDTGEVQFIIATHSPIILAYPGATLLSFSNEDIVPVKYEDTDHFKLMRNFLLNPDRFFKHLFNDSD